MVVINVLFNARYILNLFLIYDTAILNVEDSSQQKYEKKRKIQLVDF